MTAKDERSDDKNPKGETQPSVARPSTVEPSVSDDARFAEHLLVRHVGADVFHQTLMNEAHSANRRMWLFGLYALIVHLRANGERVTRASLARALECGQASLIGHLDRLAAAGLIVETPDYDPRRRPYDVADVSITQALSVLRDETDDSREPDEPEAS